MTAGPLSGFVRDVRALYSGSVATLLHRRRLQALATAFQGIVLDVGCYQAPWRAQLGDRVTRWVGLDLPLYYGQTPAADVFADCRHLPIREGTIDVVVCTRMLDNVDEPVTVFRESLRVLKPRGILVLSAHQYGPIYNVPRNYWRFTRYGLELLARRAGFGAIDVRLLGGTCAVFASLVQFHLPAVIGRTRVTRAIAALVEAALLALDEKTARERDPWAGSSSAGRTGERRPSGAQAVWRAVARRITSR